MKNKRNWIVLLVGANLFLMAVLLAGVFELPTAQAQAAGRGGGFISVVAKAAGRSYDVYYLLDVAAQRLYAVYPGNPTSRELVVAAPRDLAQDFSDQGAQPQPKPGNRP